ncbi:hypothetical protein NLI96_g3387 [Meripilus lineatus]|uniref:ATP phosphoribosyltransferase n=1 Tax=Meripilus lineatus TaxID=2056292 RepID=A0AAD5V8W4_9APHY|nr:hypothetical protein NLI96_g3387 [Physisporinus lineatus]
MRLTHSDPDSSSSELSDSGMDGISNLADQLTRSSVNPSSLNGNHHNGTTSPNSRPLKARLSLNNGQGGQRGSVDMNAESLDGRLLFAIPKKGASNTSDRLALVVLFRVALSVFLPASDIPSFVGKGNVDLGITGHDVILEANMEKHLVGKRIVTSFEVLAGKYFKELDEKFQVKVDEERTKIEYVGGSVEAACALGLADGIVDLVESGDTMRAAGLHAIETLLETEAVLIKSSVQKHPALEPLISLITSRIKGVVAAGRYVVCEYNIRRSSLAAATSVTPGRRAATVSPLLEEDWAAVSVMVEKRKVADVMDELVKIGAEDILIFNLDNCRV